MKFRLVTCRECKKQKKPSEFYASTICATKPEGLCKECQKARVRGTYWKDPEESRRKDRARSLDPDRRDQLQASLRRQREANPEKFNARARKWAKENPEKRKAQIAVGNALRSGKLKRGKCEGCGQPPGPLVHAHHDDYSKPLEVRWLCTHCHGLEHRARNEAERAAS